MLNSKLPSHLPTWPQMVDSLGLTPAQLAKVLQVSQRTIFNWNAAGQAPRAAMLALFWLTPWGDSALNTERENLLKVLQSQTNSLRNENAGLRLRIARLELTGDFGSANDPVHAPERAPLTQAVIAR